MLDNQLKQYQITINGNRLDIASPCGEEHIREVERFLDQQIAEVTQQTEALGPTNLAFLVALNLADELLNLQRRQSQYESIEQGLSNLCTRLDVALTQPGISGTRISQTPDFSTKF